jgi:hypothetical protein
LEKRENPFAPKAAVPVTATEPKIMPLDLSLAGGNDKTLTESLIRILPDWRIRDAQFDNSKIDVPILGRDHVIVLNPLNDVLPAKLIATIEIPANYAGKQPRVLFEVSSSAPNKEWLLAVRAMGAELIPKTKVKATKDAPWLDVAVPLSGLANKHFELQIEVWAHSKKVAAFKDQLGCIRNVRLEWAK